MTTAMTSEEWTAWQDAGCPDLDAWTGIWRARQEEAAKKRRPRRRGPLPPFPKDWATRERGEGGLEEQAEALLRGLQRRGQILDFIHRPDRSPGRAERAGLPDLLVAVRDGLVLGVELKRADGTVSKWQALWLRAFGDRGTVARSVEEVEDFLRRWSVEV